MHIANREMQCVNHKTTEKHLLRRHVKMCLKAHHSVKSVAAHSYILRKSLIWKNAEVVCMFWSMASEVDTRPILRMAQDMKKCLWLPLPHTSPLYMRNISRAQPTPIHQRYISHGVKAMRLHTPPRSHGSCMCRTSTLCTTDDLSVSAWLKHNVHRTMLVLVPGLAFSPCGARLGRGSGFYDRLLGMLEKHTHTLHRVGLCHEMQVLPYVPTDAHDKKMAYIVTESRLINCAYM